MVVAPDVCRLFFESMDDAVLVVDGVTHQIVDANAQAAACTAYDHGELKGLSVDRLFGADRADWLFAPAGAQAGAERWSKALELTSKVGERVRVRLGIKRKMSDDFDLVFVVMKRLVNGESSGTIWNGSRTRAAGNEGPSLVGESERMHGVRRKVDSIADSDVTVLILGESGTGKEIVAAAIHARSQRVNAPFVTVNCGALSESLLETELFGHVKGAFTGAIQDRSGRFKQADGGTLLLDEIASMSLAGQVKLLRVLQERTFEPVGSSLTTRANVRVIACSNIDLEKAVEEGAFRKDLYYRLNVFPIVVPPLRERKDDIPLLAEHFLEKYNRKFGAWVRGIAPEALALMMHYDWPGNVRELENAVEHAVIVEETGILTVDSLPRTVRKCRAQASGDEFTRALGLRDTLRVLERQIIIDSLLRANGVKKQAAAMLRIDARNMPYFMRKHRLVDDSNVG